MIVLVVSLFILGLKSYSDYTFFMVQGNSMYPTLRDGDFIIVKRGLLPRRFDLVVFLVPNDNKYEFWIKRTIGLGGDSVLIDYDSNRLYVNDQCLEENYINDSSEDPMKIMNGRVCEYYEVEANSLFVLGDNRNFSFDSRHRKIGLIRKESVIGVVVLTIDIRHKREMGGLYE